MQIRSGRRVFGYGLLIVALVAVVTAPVVGAIPTTPGPVDGRQTAVGVDGRQTAVGVDAPGQGGQTATVPTEPNETATGETRGSTGSNSPQSETSIRESFAVDRTPGDVGRVNVTYSVVVPDSVRSVAVRFENDSGVALSVVSASNFTYDAPNGTWDHRSEFGERTRATLTYTVETNTTSSDSGGYETVETAGWAFVDSPQLDRTLQYVYTLSQPEPTIRTNYSAAGTGYGDAGKVFLGPHSTERRSGSNQTFTVVFPDAADPDDPGFTASGAAGALTTAADGFDVGDRDPAVTAFVLPGPIRGGGRGGGNGFWVGATTNRPYETLLHEYVHTRQAWTDGDLLPGALGADVEWFTEASADYYGGYLAWRQGYFSAPAFQDYLSEETDSYADSVLQDGDRDSSELKNYYKGRRVLGALDLRIRNHTGGDVTLLDVFARVNAVDNETVYYSDLRREVVAVTDESTGNWLDRYVTTTDAPSIPADIEAAYQVSDRSNGTLAVRDVTVDPNATSANTTVTHDVTFRVTNVSSDNETDYGGVVVPAGQVVDGSVTVTDGDGESLVVDGPEVGAVFQESNDTLAFGIDPQPGDNTSVVSVDATLTVRYPAANESLDGPVIAVFNDSTPREANATTALSVAPGGTPAALSATVSPETVVVGERTVVTVSVVDTATGIPVENATVGLDRSGIGALSRTNATGDAAFAVNASAPGEINVTVGLNGVTARVTTLNVTNTTTHESGVSQRLFDAVAGSDGTLQRSEVIELVGAYLRGDRVGGVDVTRSDVLDLVRYYIMQ